MSQQRGEWDTPWKRVAFAIGIFLVDFITIGVPIGAIFIGYVVIARPKRLIGWIESLYGA